MKNKDMDKKQIFTQVNILPSRYTEMSVEQMISELQDIQDGLGDTFDPEEMMVSISVDQSYDEVSCSLIVTATRTETDEEYSKRIQLEKELTMARKLKNAEKMKKLRVKQEEKEKREYERLAKKYGKT